MGSIGSKLAEKVTEKPAEEQGSIPSTPILTPRIFRENSEKEYLDPRSPSKHIARTPMELLSAVADKLSTLRIETGDSDKVAVETPLKQHLILGIDPRSPTLEIQRTPIVVSASPDKKLPAKIRNKNLERVKNSTLLDTPRVVPPKLLESNPVTPKIKSDAYKRKSLVLLETNIDFTETDLDTVIQEKYSGKSSHNMSRPEEASCCEIIDPRSPTVDFVRTPIQVCTVAEPLADKLDSQNVEIVEEHLVQNVDSDIVKQCFDVGSSAEVFVNIEESVSSVPNESAQTVLPATEEDCPDKNSVPTEEVLEDENDEVNETACDQIVLGNKESSNVDMVEQVEPENIDPLEESDDSLYSGSVISEHDDRKGHVGKSPPNVDVTPCKRVSPKTPRQKDIVLPKVKEECRSILPSDPVSPPPNIVNVTPLSSTTKGQFIPQSEPVSPLPNIVSVTPKKSKSQPITPTIIDLTADVKELDKKLSNLIYEDENLVVCPRVVKIKDQSRTPLGLRNCTENRTSTQKLKVSDKPRKTLSKIPVFKEKKVKVQCENTPPRGMREAKGNKSRWDSKDDTLVI